MRRLLGLLVLALVLAGCGGTDNKATPDQTAASVGTVQLRAVSQVAGATTTTGKLADFTCPQAGAADPLAPAAVAKACDADGNRYLLAAAAWDGTATSATASIPAGQSAWTVAVTLDADGTKALAALSKQGGQIAVVVDGEVVAAPTVQNQITSGQLQITGGFDEAAAKGLANRISGN